MLSIRLIISYVILLDKQKYNAFVKRRIAAFAFIVNCEFDIIPNQKGIKMRKLIIAFGALSLAGCASIVDGRPDTINIMTSDGSPAWAQITSRTGTQTLVLPTLLTVPKSCRDVTIQVLEDRYNKQSYAVASSGVNPWIIGNVVFGGIPGLIVDGATGAMCTYDNSVIVQLNKK